MKKQGTPPSPATSKGIYGEAEVTGHYASEINGVLGNYDLPTNWPQPVMHNAPGDVPGAPVMYGPAQTPDEIGAGYGYQDVEAKPETDIFYYHSDHLGSTSYITDKF